MHFLLYDERLFIVHDYGDPVMENVLILAAIAYYNLYFEYKTARNLFSIKRALNDCNFYLSLHFYMHETMPNNVLFLQHKHNYFDSQSLL